jgi:hypothetical protein
MRPWIRTAQEHRGEPERRDPLLPLADMFDPAIAQRLWESLPDECRVDHIDKKNIPEVYRGAIKLVSSGARPVKKETAPWTSCSLNFRDLSKPMSRGIAWLLHREIELGRYIHRTCSTLRYAFCGSPPSTAPSVGVALLRCRISHQGNGSAVSSRRACVELSLAQATTNKRSIDSVSCRTCWSTHITRASGGNSMCGTLNWIPVYRNANTNRTAATC